MSAVGEAVHMGSMPTSTLTRTGILVGILAAAYRTVPASHLLSDARASHKRADYAQAFDTAVAAIETAGLTRDTMPGYAARALDDLRHTAKGTSAYNLPSRQQQLQASLAVADAMSRLLTED